MKSRLRMTVYLCATAAASGVGLAQQQKIELPPGRVYTFHSGPQSGCPSLDWHVVLEPGGDLSGMIAWNNMQSIARASGKVNPGTGAFQMTATEVGGQGRTATITGTADGNTGWLTADIQGADVKCHAVKVPWFNPYKGG
jgi:hypothetical protein